MFGPTGRPGNARSLDPQQSDLHVDAFTTSAVSYGWQVDNDRRAGKMSAVGITAKYILGNYLAIARGDPAAAAPNNFPGVYSNPDSNKVVGRGFGFDFGMAWTAMLRPIQRPASAVMICGRLVGHGPNFSFTVQRIQPATRRPSFLIRTRSRLRLRPFRRRPASHGGMTNSLRRKL